MMDIGGTPIPSDYISRSDLLKLTITAIWGDDFPRYGDRFQQYEIVKGNFLDQFIQLGKKNIAIDLTNDACKNGSLTATDGDEYLLNKKEALAWAQRINPPYLLPKPLERSIDALINGTNKASGSCTLSEVITWLADGKPADSWDLVHLRAGISEQIRKITEMKSSGAHLPELKKQVEALTKDTAKIHRISKACEVVLDELQRSGEIGPRGHREHIMRQDSSQPTIEIPLSEFQMEQELFPQNDTISAGGNVSSTWINVTMSRGAVLAKWGVDIAEPDSQEKVAVHSTNVKKRKPLNNAELKRQYLARLLAAEKSGARYSRADDRQWSSALGVTTTRSDDIRRSLLPLEQQEPKRPRGSK